MNRRDAETQRKKKVKHYETVEYNSCSVDNKTRNKKILKETDQIAYAQNQIIKGNSE